MQHPIHILNQMGVLASFSVARKVNEEDIKKFFSKQKKSGKSEKQINEMLRKQIIDDIQEAIIKNKIPGMIGSDEMAKQLGINKSVMENVPELSRLVLILAHKLAEKKYDKMSLCYFVNHLVNVLGLTEENFRKFHENNNDDEDDEDDGD